MFAITIKEPWAYTIFHHGKDIENRDWYFPLVEQEVAIHTSKNYGPGEIEAASRYLQQMYGHEIDPTKLVLGSIVGVVRMGRPSRSSKSEWFFGEWGYPIANARLLAEPIPFRGQTKFWEVPVEVEAVIRRTTVCEAYTIAP